MNRSFIRWTRFFVCLGWMVIGIVLDEWWVIALGGMLTGWFAARIMYARMDQALEDVEQILKEVVHDRDPTSAVARAQSAASDMGGPPASS